MKTSEFDYILPEELIAQTPLSDRTGSRMMVVHKNTGEIESTVFSNIVNYFHEGDVLVRNNTRVIPARLFGTKEVTGAHVELLLLRQMEDDVWECLAGNAKVIKEGTVISFHEGELRAQCVGIGEKGIRLMKMLYEGIFNEILDQLGNVPLPPYIKARRSGTVSDRLCESARLCRCPYRRTALYRGRICGITGKGCNHCGCNTSCRAWNLPADGYGNDRRTRDARRSLFHVQRDG